MHKDHQSNKSGGRWYHGGGEETASTTQGQTSQDEQEKGVLT